MELAKHAHSVQGNSETPSQLETFDTYYYWGCKQIDIKIWLCKNSLRAEYDPTKSI